MGPGHNSEIVLDDAGQYWMLYHGYDAADPDGGRKVYLDQVLWGSDGWPLVRNRVPSSTAAVPLSGEAAKIDSRLSSEKTAVKATYNLCGQSMNSEIGRGLVIKQLIDGSVQKTISR